jgi:hypothetical protein
MKSNSRVMRRGARWAFVRLRRHRFMVQTAEGQPNVLRLRYLDSDRMRHAYLVPPPAAAGGGKELEGLRLGSVVLTFYT